MTFPTDLPTHDDFAPGETLSEAGHSTKHNATFDELEALEAKVGANSSAVTTSHDYKLSGVAGTDKAVSKTGTETLTNKTLTSPVITDKSSTGTDSGAETLSNKTLTAPTISDFTNANHDHGDADDGGAILVTGIANPYKFRAYRNAAWTTPNGAVAKVALDVETYDPNNNFSGGTYTVPVTGYYLISACVGVIAATSTVLAYIYKNGALVSTGSRADGVSGAHRANVVDILSLVAGDTIELYCYTSTAVAGSYGQSEVYISGHLFST